MAEPLGRPRAAWCQSESARRRARGRASGAALLIVEPSGRGHRQVPRGQPGWAWVGKCASRCQLNSAHPRRGRGWARVGVGGPWVGVGGRGCTVGASRAERRCTWVGWVAAVAAASPPPCRWKTHHPPVTIHGHPRPTQVFISTRVAMGDECDLVQLHPHLHCCRCERRASKRPADWFLTPTHAHPPAHPRTPTHAHPRPPKAHPCPPMNHP